MISAVRSTLIETVSRPLPSDCIDAVTCEDNAGLMARLPDGCCDLIYVDPPFDAETTGNPTGSSPAGRPSRCGPVMDEYLDFVRPRLREMHRLLSPRGSLYVHIDWRSVHHVRLMLDEIFGAQNFLNEIIWSYRSGSRPGRWFARKHDTLLLYARNAGRHVFHPPRGGDYRTEDLRYDRDGRPYKSTRRGRIDFHPDGPLISDVWDLPILSTVSRERTGYPYQKPEALLTRIVKASSEPGSVVADFFCGSGTALVAAHRLARRYIGCDISPDAVAITRKRLLGSMH